MNKFNIINPNNDNNFFNNKNNFINSFEIETFEFNELKKIYDKEYTELVSKIKVSDEFKNLNLTQLTRKQLTKPLTYFIEQYVKKNIIDDKNLFQKSKAYLTKHIAQYYNGNCPYYLINSNTTISLSAFEKVYITKFPLYIRDWFKQADFIKQIKIEPKDSRRIINNRYINGFKGFKFKTIPLDKYDAKTVEKAEWILDKYIFNFLSNKEKNIFNFIKSWISNITRGNKNEVMIILESVLKGVGKSTFIKLLVYMLGKNATLKGHTKDILGNTNIHWLGKIFVYFEEFGVSKNDYEKLSNELKDLITEDTMRYRGLFKDPINEKNICSFISCSNNLRCIKDNTGRRFLTLDLPAEKYKGDTKFFKKLYSYIGDDTVMSYLFNYFKLYNIDVNLREAPETIKKIKATVLSYTPIHNFIRYKYLFVNRRIWCRKTDLLTEYIKYREEEDDKFEIKNKIQFKKLFYNDLQNKLGITSGKVSGYVVFHISIDKLVELSKKYKYDIIDDNDEFFDKKTIDYKKDLDFIATKTFEELKKEKDDEIKRLQCIIYELHLKYKIDLNEIRMVQYPKKKYLKKNLQYI